MSVQKRVGLSLVLALLVSMVGFSLIAGAAGSQIIKIAIIEPISGPFAQNGQNSVNGAQLAVDEINAAGGIKALGGATLKLVKADVGGGDPTHAVDVTRRVIQDNPDLTAVIGLWASSYTLPASAVTEEKHIPLLTESFSDQLTEQGHRYIFKYPAKSSAFAHDEFEYITNLARESNFPLEKLGIIAANLTEGLTIAKTIAGLAQEQGIQVTSQEYYSPGLQDATSMATKALAGDPDIIYVDGALNDAALLIKSLRGLGFTGGFLGLGNAYVLPDYYKATGQAGNGAFAAVAWNWDVPYPGAAEFNEKYTSTFNVPFAPQESGQTYAMVYTLRQALEAAKSADPEKVRDALAEVEVSPSVMVGGKVAFDETGMDEYTHPLLIEWLDGKPHIVAPAADASTEAVFDIQQ